MSYKEIQTATVYLKEYELTEILKALPDTNTPLRRYLQDAGVNRFRW